MDGETFNHLLIDGFSFELGNGAADAVSRSRFPHYALMKSRSGVAELRQRVAVCRGVIQMGVMRGGSCALIEALFRPDRHLAIDIHRQDHDGMDALAAYVSHDARALLADFDTPQDDVARILALWSDGPLDLVIDDASHDYALTKASFNGLFAKLAPGGLYVIEDWAVSHWSIGDLTPILTDLGRAAACSPDMVAEIAVTQDALFVRRGPASGCQFAI